MAEEKKLEKEVTPKTTLASSQTPETKSSFTPFQTIIIVMLSIAVLIGSAALIIFWRKNSQKEVLALRDAAQQEASNTSAPVSIVPPPVDANAPVANTAVQEEEPTEPEVIKPNLYIKSYGFDENIEMGDEFTVQIEIGNKGTARANNFFWEWWPTSSGEACRKAVDSIPAGGTKYVECNYTYNDSNNHSTKVVVDSDYTVDESNENDNVATRNVKPFKELGKPDLYVSDYEFDHDPVQGEEFEVRITIKNKGESDADSFWWEWWPTVTGNKVCREKVDELKAGESETVECDYTYGGWANYKTQAVIDADDDVDEEEENNNTHSENVIPIH